ncbi:uncharacterized protein DUF2530 [Haloactinospora alba]|uniref:Uncharacterized protein DUF2530 n=1 Tax=Haloactinospora alba TaxID=405555 RepID=A0A543N783_9ACTN|nr:DUF2530 domain-containing protein [Haloactinospora alba]TQN27663.1 uncharacterized protein DUF2530 [Haloactinospora alba]
MRQPRRPDPEVLEGDYRVPTALGTLAWLAALLVLLALGDRLAEEDRWWIGVCLTGIALGVFGYLYIPRLLRKRAEAEERNAEYGTAGGDGASGGDAPEDGEERGADGAGDTTAPRPDQDP